MFVSFSPASSTPPCFLWPGTEGLEVSPHHSRVLFPLEVAVGCLLIWSEILNLDLAAPDKHCWLWNSSVYLSDRLPVITLHSALAACGIVPVLTFPHFELKANKILCNKTVLKFQWAATEIYLRFYLKKKKNLNGHFINFKCLYCTGTV